MIEDERADFINRKPDIERLRDCIAGQRAMQEARDSYVRRPEGMSDPKEWAAYVEHVPFFEATSRTVDGLSGMATYGDPTLELDPATLPLSQDMTMDGIDVFSFADALVEEVISVARVGVLVDFPPADPAVVTRRDEIASGRRPFARLYRHEAIFNWTSAKVRNSRQLVEVRLHEAEVTTDPTDFSQTIERRIRLLQLTGSDAIGWTYRQRVLIEQKGENDKTTYVEQLSLASTPLIDGKPLDFIPFWFCNPRDQSDVLVKPPLLGLANSNVAHFNTSAMLERVLSFVGAPQPYVAGVTFGDDDEAPTIGSAQIWTFQDANVKVGYLECSADGVKPLESRLTALEQHMALQGARMLSPDRNGVEAAQTAAIHRQGEISVLASCCNSVSAVISQVLRFMAEWAGLPVPTSQCFKLDTAFFEEPMTPDDAVKLVQVWQSGVIAYGDLLLSFKRGKLVRSDRTEDAIAAENQSGLIQPSLAAGLTVSGGGAPSAAPANGA